MSDKGTLKTAEVAFYLSEAKSCERRQLIELVNRNNYPFLINYYEGFTTVDPIHPHVNTEQRLAIIEEYFPNTNSLISELLFKNPDILLDATKPQAEDGTPTMKSALNYLFDKGDWLTENRVGLFDMIYAGYTPIEVNQIPVEKNEEVAEIKQETNERPSVFDKFAKGVKKALNPEEAERNLAKQSPQMETNFSTVQGTYLRRYDPLDVPLDWRAERIKDRRYNLKKVWMSKAEFDVKYPKFKDQVSEQEHRFEYSKHNMTMHNQKVLLYEFQVRLKGNKYQTIIISPNVLTQDLDSFIRPYTTNNFNMKIGTLHKYGKLYPISFAQVNKKMQDEMNNYVRHMMNVAERNIPKYVSDKNKVKGDAIAALTNTKVNDNVQVDGNTTGAVTPLQPTNVSLENKELLAVFRSQKQKLWSVSEAKIAGTNQNEFATDSAIQEAGFQAKNIDIQEGLRLLIRAELDTGKDLIANFWDEEVFLKVTGGDKVDWYEPEIRDGKVINPLSDILKGDYNVDIDIASARQENEESKLQKRIFYLTQVAQLRPIMNEQGFDINIDEIRKEAKSFGWNPDTIFIEYKPQNQLNVPTAGGETISSEEDAARQAQAQEQAGGGGTPV